MRMPQGLKKLDDRVLGERGASRRHDDHDDHDRQHTDHDDVYPDGDGERTEVRTVRTQERPHGGNGDGVQTFLSVLWRISRLVLLLLGLVVLAAAALVLLPANEDNVLVRNVLSLAETVAGPFRDVLTVDDPDRMRVYNYGLAAVVYLVLAAIVGKLPTGSKRTG
jgi:hypothetical protein